MIELTHDPIDAGAVTGSVRTTAAGGVVTFLGAVRDNSQGKAVDHLVYEAYEPMAEKTLRELADEARQRWPLEGVAIVHRLGRLAPGLRAGTPA